MAMLTIEDDGRGGRIREGNGIRGMRERLAMLDGTLDIESGRDGTRLMACLPLAGLADENDEPQVQTLPGVLKNWRSAP
jgi:glucose-6-phosphate-specific signal transduction histidine kinase